MIICPKCGDQLRDDAIFCKSCGTKVQMQQTPVFDSRTPAFDEPMQGTGDFYNLHQAVQEMHVKLLKEYEKMLGSKRAELDNVRREAENKNTQLNIAVQNAGAEILQLKDEVSELKRLLNDKDAQIVSLQKMLESKNAEIEMLQKDAQPMADEAEFAADNLPAPENVTDEPAEDVTQQEIDVRDVDVVKRCPKCSTIVDDETIFCPECGTRIV